MYFDDLVELRQWIISRENRGHICIDGLLCAQRGLE
jgi:hypothetical protein